MAFAATHSKSEFVCEIKKVLPGNFHPEDHWYPKALNAIMHPMVRYFLEMGPERIIHRYCHLHPGVKEKHLEKIFSYMPHHFLWSGADLINVCTADGKRNMLLIENNSCPSGQKSMPLLNEMDEMGGYRYLLEKAFKPYIESLDLPEGKLGVIYDKNHMEATGYAAAMAEIFNEEVYLIKYLKDEDNEQVRVTDGVLEFKEEGRDWQPLRAAFRYVTQKPWNRIPVESRTAIFNPIVACLAGGRNKMVAAKAYERYNATLAGSGLRISTPDTNWDLTKAEIPAIIKNMGGKGVIKSPYSNAGQGVFTIVNQQEMDEFMQIEFQYEKFIVQTLIGNSKWSSETEHGKFFHVGTIPDKRGHTYAADLRMMVCATSEGYRPIAMYARRAAAPLQGKLDSAGASWQMLGTNLSVILDSDTWTSDTNRLMLMDHKDFNILGIGMDDLVEAYIQTMLSSIAIDRMAAELMEDGRFNDDLFRSFNNDQVLINEIFRE
jgi:hypothetical protein